ncbi:sulfite exporter TauE/SafE family protein [Pseudomaricurvus alkylphenolicus]|uniref:sulfite exporter TauE/SafE family protein n=1 Tax=Pseudomaricurvus alkylphenolicus TaxID=1306991 RepID=UPI00141F4F45|nr:sulfite exporter TauE/SafE family protein [Pseudomaricurvus alkylphenolicus]NIB45189.1 sulfite exporter TauE/SafE family protein [Pseudomaricurvus alkylphenolicus]
MIIAVGVIIGLVLGVTGAGGSIFAVPLFVLLLGIPLMEAMGISLGAVSVAAMVGVLVRNNRRDLAITPGIILAIAGMITAPLGRWVGLQIDEGLLMLGFSLLAGGLSIRMWMEASSKKRASSSLTMANRNPAYCSRIDWAQALQLACAGLFCGVLSGLFGVGGGFIIVPLLTLYVGMDINRAVGTSLFVIALVSATGFAFHLQQVSTIPADRLFYTIVGSIFGVLIGTPIAKYLSGPKLQKLFASSVIGLVVLTLSRTNS